MTAVPFSTGAGASSFWSGSEMSRRSIVVCRELDDSFPAVEIAVHLPGDRDAPSPKQIHRRIVAC